MYPKNNQFCFACVNPCNTCINESHCLTCANGTGYLTNGQCVEADNCPDGTYADDLTRRCVGCPSGCTLCDNSTICTECSSVYFFYDNQCLTQCPSGTYKESGTCQPCTSPCSTCITTSLNCLSCESPKLFYQNACHTTCPDSTYASNSNC